MTWTARWWAKAATSKLTSMSRATWAATTTWLLTTLTLTWTKIRTIYRIGSIWRWYLANEIINNSLSTWSSGDRNFWQSGFVRQRADHDGVVGGLAPGLSWSRRERRLGLNSSCMGKNFTFFTPLSSSLICLVVI
jgi:hypothetical protein